MIFTLLIWIFCFYSWASMVVISESSTFHDKYFACIYIAILCVLILLKCTLCKIRKKNIKKQIWIDAKEDELLKKKSKQAGLSESEFIRSLIKGYRIKEQPTEEIKFFQREIYGIANNINQIARISNSRYSTSNDDYSYISKNLSDFILRFEKEIYSRKK